MVLRAYRNENTLCASQFSYPPTYISWPLSRCKNDYIPIPIDGLARLKLKLCWYHLGKFCLDISGIVPFHQFASTSNMHLWQNRTWLQCSYIKLGYKRITFTHLHEVENDTIYIIFSDRHLRHSIIWMCPNTVYVSYWALLLQKYNVNWFTATQYNLALQVAAYT